jgi:integrase
MGYKTHILKNLNVPNSTTSKNNTIDTSGEFTILSADTRTIKTLTIVIEEGTGFIIPSVLEYLVNRIRTGKKDSSLEARGLRSYFDFLSRYGLQWDVGSVLDYERPLHQFARELEVTYRAGSIAGSTAVSYFKAVVRFYKYHLKFSYPFQGVPIEFKSFTYKKFDNDLTSHITGLEIKIETATCKPNINANAKKRELKPLSNDELKVFLSTALNKASDELMLIYLIAVGTGLRISEIADLRLDMITSYGGVGSFDMKVGPQVSHETKKSKDATVEISSSNMKILLKYAKSSRFLSRYSKLTPERPNLFLDKNGKAYTQHTLSTLSNEFMNDNIRPTHPNFEHKFHDLRATFGVYLMKACLGKGYSVPKSLAHVKIKMRHESLKDTEHYLKYWETSEVSKKMSTHNEELLSDVYTELDSRYHHAA